MLAMAALLFVSNRLVGAAAPDDDHYSLLSAQALARWAVTVDQLRDHPKYHAELVVASQMIDQSLTVLYSRFLEHCDRDTLANAQADLDTIATLPKMAENPKRKARFINIRQTWIERDLQERAARKKEIETSRVMLNPQFAAIRASQEYTETLADIQARTREAKNNDKFKPSDHYHEIWMQTIQYTRDKQYEKIQAILDLLYASKYTYPAVDELNSTQRSNNMYLEWKQRDAEREANRGILVKIGEFIIAGIAMLLPAPK